MQLCTHMAVSAFTGMFACVWRILDTVVYVIIFYMAQFLLHIKLNNTDVNVA